MNRCGFKTKRSFTLTEPHLVFGPEYPRKWSIRDMIFFNAFIWFWKHADEQIRLPERSLPINVFRTQVLQYRWWYLPCEFMNNSEFHIRKCSYMFSSWWKEYFSCVLLRYPLSLCWTWEILSEKNSQRLFITIICTVRNNAKHAHADFSLILNILWLLLYFIFLGLSLRSACCIAIRIRWLWDLLYINDEGII